MQVMYLLLALFQVLLRGVGAQLHDCAKVGGSNPLSLSESASNGWCKVGPGYCGDAQGKAFHRYIIRAGTGM